ncbi:MAG: hypothetical protein M0Z37_08905 [Nitrospiraceae bacterium]|jgi:hypothetical protein|nr:hypothetical protein [Nitrospiraceae bacterium]
MKSPQKSTVCYVRIGDKTITLKGVYDLEQMTESGRMIAANVEKIIAEEGAANEKLEVVALILAIEKNYEVLSKERELAHLKQENDRWRSLFETTVKNLLDIQASSKKALVDRGRRG